MGANMPEGTPEPLACICGAVPQITRTEIAMAASTGLDVIYIHRFMDTWETHADRVIDGDR